MKRVIGLALLVCCGASSAAWAQDRAAGKLPQLNAAVVGACQLIRGLNGPGLAEKRIEGERVFDGRFVLVLELLEKPETANDGKVVLLGAITVPRGDVDRYRTSEERGRLARAVATLKDVGREHALIVRAAIIEVKRASQLAARVHRTSRRKLSEDRAVEQRRRELRAAKSARSHAVGRAKADVKACEEGVAETAGLRQRQCEMVFIGVEFAPDRAARIDLAKLEKAGKIKLLCRVAGFDLAREPAEIGGELHVRTFTMFGLSVEKKLRKKP